MEKKKKRKKIAINQKSTSLENICARIGKCMINEDRKDLEFRFIIAATEFGDVGKYITHDPLLNPGARPHGTKEDEKLAYGQALVQIMALAHLRNIDVVESIKKGIENWEQADWRKAQAKKIISGGYINPRDIEGIAYVVSSEHQINDFPDGKILVTEYFTPDMAMYGMNALAIITDHGGMTCHAANIAREYNISCIVGTGNATQVIKHNSKISIKADNNTGIITSMTKGE